MPPTRPSPQCPPTKVPGPQMRERRRPSIFSRRPSAAQGVRVPRSRPGLLFVQGVVQIEQETERDRVSRSLARANPLRGRLGEGEPGQAASEVDKLPAGKCRIRRRQLWVSSTAAGPWRASSCREGRPPPGFSVCLQCPFAQEWGPPPTSRRSPSSRVRGRQRGFMVGARTRPA